MNESHLNIDNNSTVTNETQKYKANITDILKTILEIHSMSRHVPNEFVVLIMITVKLL